MTEPRPVGRLTIRCDPVGRYSVVLEVLDDKGEPAGSTTGDYHDSPEAAVREVMTLYRTVCRVTGFGLRAVEH